MALWIRPPDCMPRASCRLEAGKLFNSQVPSQAGQVVQSDCEIVTGAYRRGDLPAGALVGLPVSAGITEGRARVIHDMAEPDLEPGDILVTAYTDPVGRHCSSRSAAW